MCRVSAFVPGHISGFFKVYEESDNPLKIGSRNCGLCISNGVKTTIEVENSSSSKIEVFIDDEKTTANTTRSVVEKFLKHVENEKKIIINHNIQAPMGSGYGMSGAGALGTSLALSKALNLDLDQDELLSKAHEAEIVCRSGLGDVGPQMIGGMVITKESGAPPYGKWEKIDLDSDWRIISATIGSLSTAGFLENSESKRIATELGEIAMGDLLKEKNLERFMKVSKKFAKSLGVYDDEFLNILENISNKCPHGASIVMLGKAIFAPVKKPNLKETEKLFLDYFDSAQLMKTSVDFQGARLC